MYKTVKQLSMLGFGLGVSAVVGWLFLRERRSSDALKSSGELAGQEQGFADSSLAEIVLPLESISMDDAEASSGYVDDLTRIKGIGPRFASALQEVGVTTYAALAEHTPESLAARLAPHVSISEHRIRQADWIGQARQLAKN